MYLFQPAPAGLAPLSPARARASSAPAFAFFGNLTEPLNLNPERGPQQWFPVFSNLDCYFGRRTISDCNIFGHFRQGSGGPALRLFNVWEL
jgi:hypothetical protein